MDIAIVTGANTRTGLAISRKLIEIGCRVYGLGSDFSSLPLEDSNFVPVTCDLTSTEHLCQIFQEILNKEKDIYVLVNHAKHLHLAAHEKQGLNDLESLVQVNLLTPLILTRMVLPSLIRLNGYVINIGFPDSLKNHKLGSAFLSAEVGLMEFSKRLFEEVRQDGVRVCSLVLDTANAETFTSEGFSEQENSDLILDAESIAQSIEYVLSQKSDSVISNLVVRPQKREPDAKDLRSVRKISPAKPFIPRKPVEKAVIGRLQKEVEAESTEKAPTTYMDMARELAEEEVLNPESSNKPGDIRELHEDSKTDPKYDSTNGALGREKSGNQKNRRRPRRRNQRKRDSQTQEPANRDKPKTGSPQKQNRDKPQPKPRRPKRNDNQPVNPKTPAPEKVASSNPKDKVLTKKRPAKKIVKEAPVKKPAAKSAPKKPADKVKQVIRPSAAKKSVAQKEGKKRVARKVAKKAPKKPTASKSEDS
jgi:NADP-dependent 3-hydroxy acid dehydrogenase YdfG